MKPVLYWPQVVRLSRLLCYMAPLTEDPFMEVAYVKSLGALTQQLEMSHCSRGRALVKLREVSS